MQASEDLQLETKSLYGSEIGYDSANCVVHEKSSPNPYPFT
jgi:hypothetical protein